MFDDQSVSTLFSHSLSSPSYTLGSAWETMEQPEHSSATSLLSDSLNSIHQEAEVPPSALLRPFEVNAPIASTNPGLTKKGYETASTDCAIDKGSAHSFRQRVKVLRGDSSDETKKESDVSRPARVATARKISEAHGDDDGRPLNNDGPLSETTSTNSSTDASDSSKVSSAKNIDPVPSASEVERTASSGSASNPTAQKEEKGPSKSAPKAKIKRKASRSKLSDDGGDHAESSKGHSSADESLPRPSSPRRSRPKTPKSASARHLNSPRRKSMSAMVDERGTKGSRSVGPGKKDRRISITSLTLNLSDDGMDRPDTLPSTIVTGPCSDDITPGSFELPTTRIPRPRAMYTDAKSVVSTNDWDEEYGDMSGSGHSVTDRHKDDVGDTLTWRLDPIESLSDWTIRMTSKDNGAVKDFHVHKNILAVGKRKSEYFAGIYRNAAQKPGSPPVTNISMGSAALKAAPALLDFMYSTEPLQVSSENAVGLRYLARKFGVKKGFDDTMEFIQKDFTLETIADYYVDGVNLSDEKILGTAANLCGRNILTLSPSNDFFKVVDPPFMAKIMASPGIDDEEKCQHVSLLLVAYCQHNKDILDGDTFRVLTSEKLAPLIHRDAALPLLEMEADLVVATSVHSFTVMSSLQQRCLRDISGHWHELSEKDPQETTRICRKLPSFVVAELLGRSLVFSRVTSAPDAHKSRSENEAADEMEQLRKDMARLKSNYEAKIKFLEDVSDEKEKRIEKYLKELQCFERLSNSHEGKLVCSGLLKGHPTQMPEVGEHEKEGYILISKKGSQRCPIFYYKCDS
jgi:hypothetical protein